MPVDSAKTREEEEGGGRGHCGRGRFGLSVLLSLTLSARSVLRVFFALAELSQEGSAVAVIVVVSVPPFRDF